MNKKTAWGLAAFGLFVVALVSVALNVSEAAKAMEPITGEALQNNPRVKVEGNLSAIEEGGVRYASGVLRNISGKMLKSVEVSVALYDASGAQIGTARDGISDLAAGASWKFKASVLDEGVTRAELVKIEAW